MPLPSPDDYGDWKEFARALLIALGDGGLLAQTIADDPDSNGILVGHGVTNNVPSGYAPIWLKQADADLYLADSTYSPPPAENLFQVDTAQIAEAAITGTRIAVGAVGTTHIVDAAIVTAKIGEAQIVTALIADLAVNTGKIANLAVGAAQIANLAVGSAKIEDLAVTSIKIGALAVTSAKIDDLAVTNAKIGLLAVGTANILDANITSAKINDLAVTSAKINNAAITSAKIGNLAVQAAHIDALAVTTAKINDLSVTNIKIGGYEINEEKIMEHAISIFDEISLTGFTQTLTVAGGATIIEKAGVDCQVFIDSADITGDQIVLCFVSITFEVTTDTAVDIYVEKEGTTLLSPLVASLDLLAGTTVTHSITFLDFSVAQNTDYDYVLWATTVDASVDVSSATLTAMLLKR